MIIKDIFVNSASPEDSSDEGSQHMVSMRNKNNYPSIIIKYSLLSRALLQRVPTLFSTYRISSDIRRIFFPSKTIPII